VRQELRADSASVRLTQYRASAIGCRPWNWGRAYAIWVIAWRGGTG